MDGETKGMYENGRDIMDDGIPDYDAKGRADGT